LVYFKAKLKELWLLEMGGLSFKDVQKL